MKRTVEDDAIAIAKTPRGVNVEYLESISGKSKSHCYNVIRSLEKDGYIHRRTLDESDYVLGGGKWSDPITCQSDARRGFIGGFSPFDESLVEEHIINIIKSRMINLKGNPDWLTIAVDIAQHGIVIVADSEILGCIRRTEHYKTSAKLVEDMADDLRRDLRAMIYAKMRPAGLNFLDFSLDTKSDLA